MELLVSDSINIYNKLRPHLSNKMLTPFEMHSQKNQKMKTYKTKKENEVNLVLS